MICCFRLTDPAGPSEYLIGDYHNTWLCDVFKNSQGQDLLYIIDLEGRPIRASEHVVDLDFFRKNFGYDSTSIKILPVDKWAKDIDGCELSMPKRTEIEDGDWEVPCAPPVCRTWGNFH